MPRSAARRCQSPFHSHPAAPDRKATLLDCNCHVRRTSQLQNPFQLTLVPNYVAHSALRLYRTRKTWRAYKRSIHGLETWNASRWKSLCTIGVARNLSWEGHSWGPKGRNSRPKAESGGGVLGEGAARSGDLHFGCTKSPKRVLWRQMPCQSGKLEGVSPLVPPGLRLCYALFGPGTDPISLLMQLLEQLTQYCLTAPPYCLFTVLLIVTVILWATKWWRSNVFLVGFLLVGRR